MKIVAGIVLYNPDINRLIQNIRAIIDQVDEMLLVDNSSRNIDEILKILTGFNIYLIRNSNNKGIAYALNQIAKFSNEMNADWFLTLDQDSVVNVALVCEYKKVINSNLGLITCVINDRNCDVDKVEMVSDFELIKYCISSGSFVSVNAYNKTHGFDDYMFIDKVDFDFCLSLLEAGFKIGRISYEGLLHEVGHSRHVRFLGKNYMVYNHSSIRRYYMSRNAIYISRKHKSLSVLNELLKEIRRILLVFLFEDKRKEKIISSLIGLRDGFQK